MKFARVLISLLVMGGVCSAYGEACPEDRRKVFSVHDLNQDGYLDQAEFERLRANCRAVRAGKGRRPCDLEFIAIDGDGDGRIDEQEMVAAIQRAPGRHRHGWHP